VFGLLQVDYYWAVAASPTRPKERDTYPLACSYGFRSPSPARLAMR
jgi:hypothetical protein